MNIEQQKARNNEKQKADIIDKLWQARNIVTGYGVIQAVYFMFAMANQTHGYYLLIVPPIPLVIVVIVGLSLYFLVFKQMFRGSTSGVDHLAILEHWQRLPGGIQALLRVIYHCLQAASQASNKGNVSKRLVPSDSAGLLASPLRRFWRLG